MFESADNANKLLARNPLTLMLAFGLLSKYMFSSVMDQMYPAHMDLKDTTHITNKGDNNYEI